MMRFTRCKCPIRVSIDLAGVLPDPASREPLQRWVARHTVTDLMDLPGDNTGFNRVTNAIGEVTNHRPTGL